MDQYTQAAAAYLRSKRGVTSVSAETSTAVSELEIANWESQNLPHELPEEYKALLRNSNGFRLTWDLIFRGEPIQLGEMCINPLRDVKKVQLNVSVKDDREPLEKCLNVRRSKLPVAAFSLDKHCKCGVVALIYFRREMGSKEAPEVWFQDLSGRWNFLSSTFIVYFRMMVAHLGLPNWQYRFTEYGMDPISKQWFFLISPDKFTFDLNSQNVRGEKMGNASAGGTNRPVSKVTAGGPTPVSPAAFSTHTHTRDHARTFSLSLYLFLVFHAFAGV